MSQMYETRLELEKELYIRLLWPDAYAEETSKGPSYRLCNTGSTYGENLWELHLRYKGEVRVIPFDEIPAVFLSEQQLRIRDSRRKRRAAVSAE